jgi:hypothetical protein
MDDLRRRFAGLDRLRAPDLWDEIELRAATLGSTQRLTSVPVPVTRSRGASGRSLVVLLAALALLVSLLAGAVAVGSGLMRLPAIIDRTPPPAQVLDFPNLTTTFVSPRNGFSINHPDRAALTPATQLWGFSEHLDDGFDVVETGLAAVFKGASTAEGFGPDGLSIDERVDEYLASNWPSGCGVPRSEQAEFTIDGMSGRISECPNQIEATVVAGDRLYLFALLHDRSDARAVFDAFAATIDLRPETAVDVPGLTTTFVSPTNGYSFGYIDRGGLVPATELWDPVIDGTPDTSSAHDAPFDGVETGLGAYFKAASAEIPSGVSIDGWVDEHVSSGGCDVPRREQAEISIDGEPGRIAECANRVEATVVADGRLYLFILLHSRPDARAFFDAWIATIDLTPETAAVP